MRKTSHFFTQKGITTTQSTLFISQNSVALRLSYGKTKKKDIEVPFLLRTVNHLNVKNTAKCTKTSYK